MGEPRRAGGSATLATGLSSTTFFAGSSHTTPIITARTLIAGVGWPRAAASSSSSSGRCGVVGAVATEKPPL